MLPKNKRINLKREFEWVTSGKSLNTKYLKLFLKTGENQIPRIGIAISSKTFKKAHERNRAKRLAAEAVHNTYYLLPNTINIVALPKSGILEVKSYDVLVDLQQTLRNEKIIS